MSGFKGVGADRDGPVHQASNDPPGASWNYRLIEFADQDGSPWLSIHEVHYRDGVPYGYGETSADASSEDCAGVAWVLDQMSKALLRPTLRERDFTVGALIVEPILPAETDLSGPQRSEVSPQAPDENPLNPSETNHG